MRGSKAVRRWRNVLNATQRPIDLSRVYGSSPLSGGASNSVSDDDTVDMSDLDSSLAFFTIEHPVLGAFPADPLAPGWVLG